MARTKTTFRRSESKQKWNSTKIEEEFEQMVNEDKYSWFCSSGAITLTDYKGGTPYVVNQIWNSLHDEIQKYKSHGINHTEEEYRQICLDFKEKMDEKNKLLREANKTCRTQFIHLTKLASDLELIREEHKRLREELQKTKEDYNETKKIAEKLPLYKEEFKRAAKRLRTIEDYIVHEDCRTFCTIEEYENTDPDLRMFFQIQ